MYAKKVSVVKNTIVLLGTLFFLIANNCYSSGFGNDEHVVVVSDIRRGVNLDKDIQLYKDESRMLGIEDVVNKDFTPNRHDYINLGYNNDADWIKFSVYNVGDLGPAILKIDKLLIDSISLYSYNKYSNEWDSLVQGTYVRRFKKPIPGWGTYLPIYLPKNDTATFYLRYVSAYGKGFSVSIVNPPLLHHGDMTFSLYLGVFAGVLLAITLYNLFLGYSINDRLYYYYALSNLFALLGGIAVQGFFVYYMPDGLIALIPYVTSISIGLFVLFSCIFNIRILELRKNSRFAYYLMLSVAVFCFSVIVGLNFLRLIGKPTNYSFITISGFLFSLAAFVAGIIAYHKGTKYARFYLIGWASVFVGLLLLSLTLLGYIPKNVFTGNFYSVGLSLEVLLLSFALADRYNLIQKEKNKLESELQFKTSDLTKVVTDNKVRHLFKVKLLNQLRDIQSNRTESVKQELGSFITDLNIQINGDERRNQLQEKIDTVNTEFETKLKERFPKLTKNEIEICSYLKLNLSMKEIAGIRNIGIKAVKMAKYRINKKMQEADTSIDEVLNEI